MQYLSKRRFALRLDVSIRTIDRYIAQKRITAKTLVTGRVRIPETELDKCFKPTIQEFLNENS